MVEAEHLKVIGNLRFLKTLDLSTVYIDELPSCIINLKQLEILLTQMDAKLPDGIGKLRLLQQLSWLNVTISPNNLAELGKLTELRVLHISGLPSHMKTFLQSLSKLRNIRSIEFYGDGPITDLYSLNCTTDQWTVPGHLQSFKGSVTFCLLPQWFSLLSELCSLSIMVKQLKRGDIQLLGALPVLRFLELRVDEGGTTDEQLVIGAGEPFDSLADFKFYHYTSCWMEFAEGVMPKLHRLHLYFHVRNRKDGCFDIGLENLTSLKHVIVRVDCTGSRIMEVDDAERKIRDATDMLPNHPDLDLSRDNIYLMAKDGSEDNCEDWEQQSLNFISTSDESDNNSED